MALIPCNVCGTLNSEEAEICLSCEYPIRGRRRSPLFMWAAILMFATLTVPLLAFLLTLWKPQKRLKSVVSLAPIHDVQFAMSIPMIERYQALRTRPAKAVD